MRQYNLSLQEALEISDHLPVWAEFSIFEGEKKFDLVLRLDTEKADVWKIENFGIWKVILERLEG